VSTVDFDTLIHESLVKYLVSQLNENEVKVSEAAFLLYATVDEQGNLNHFLRQGTITADDGHPGFIVHTDSSGLTFVIKEGNESYFQNMEIKCQQLTDEAGEVRELIRFLPLSSGNP
jgi:hypothetical protein